MKLMSKIRKMRNEDRTVAEETYYEKRLFFIDISPVGFFVEASFSEMEDFEFKIYEWLYDDPMMSTLDLFRMFKRITGIKSVLYSQELGWADTNYIKDGFFDIWETRTCESYEDGNSLECLVLRPINPNCCCVDDKYYQFKGGLHVQ